MRVEVWSDYMCPFCYIGKRRFEKGLADFAHREEVEVVYRSFELDPNSPKSVDHDVHQMLALKYGMSREQAIANNKNVGQQAAAEGLAFNFDDMVLTNTFDAHRLSHFAAAHGKRTEVSELLFKAYFTDSRHLGEHEVLADIAAEAGLNREAALAVLAGSQYAQEVRAEEEEGARLGIRGVPFYVIDRKFGVSGAQPAHVFLGALQQAWDEGQSAGNETHASGDAGGGDACDDGSCAVK
ncbi:DsbA family oxidoreductase [Paenibacillus xanthanilyticus]|uniref:DsbA family oxidoreductase n=1 Tax=Paenibacillus xanthanilyticus TaxID=1783531 RepID=A0ABV8K3Q4_9BACL